MTKAKKPTKKSPAKKSAKKGKGELAEKDIEPVAGGGGGGIKQVGWW
jgi:hypothetical protein